MEKFTPKTPEWPAIDISGLSDETLFEASMQDGDSAIKRQAEDLVDQRIDDGSFDESAMYADKAVELAAESDINPDMAIGRVLVKIYKHRNYNTMSRAAKAERLASKAEVEANDDIEAGPFDAISEKIMSRAEKLIDEQRDRYVANGYAKSIFGGAIPTLKVALMSGYEDAERYKVEGRNPEYVESGQYGETLQKIRQDVVERVAEDISEGEFAEMRKDAFLDVLHTGVTLDWNGRPKQILPTTVLTLEQEVRGNAMDRFARRYGDQYKPQQTRELADFIEHHSDLKLDSEEARRASYSGFMRIADVLKDEQEPDVSTLDWYVEKMHYADNKDDLFAAMETFAEKNPSAANFLNQYFESRGIDFSDDTEEPDDHEEAADVDFYDVVDEDLTKTAEKLARIPASYQEIMRDILMKYEKTPDDISPLTLGVVGKLGLFGAPAIPSERQPSGGGVVYTEPKSTIEEARQKVINREYTTEFTESKSKKRGARAETGTTYRDIYEPTERRAFENAKIFALAELCQSVRERGIDANAQLYLPDTDDNSATLSDKRFALVVFNHEGKTCVIGETAGKAAIYTWQGEDPDGWREVFCKRQKLSDAAKIDGVRRFNHMGLGVGLVHRQKLALNYLIKNKAV